MKLREVSKHLNEVNSHDMNMLKLAEECQELAAAILQSITRPNKVSDVIDEAADVKIRLRVFEDYLKQNEIENGRKQFRERLNKKGQELLAKHGRELKHEFYITGNKNRVESDKD